MPGGGLQCVRLQTQHGRSPQFSLAHVEAPTAFELFSNPEPKGT